MTPMVSLETTEVDVPEQVTLTQLQAFQKWAKPLTGMIMEWLIRRRQERTFNILGQYFTVSPENVKQERMSTLVTAAFSHLELHHILGNLAAFWTFSEMLLACGIGFLNYGLLILGSAISGNWTFLLQASRIQPSWWDISTFRPRGYGLSGVVMGLGVVILLAAPTATVFNPGAFRIPVYLVMILYIVYASMRLEDPTSMLGHATHIGGAAFGALFSLVRPRNTALPFTGLLEK